MTTTSAYIRILGGIAHELSLDTADLVRDLIRLDAIASQFVEAGVTNLLESSTWGIFRALKDDTLETPLVRLFIDTIYDTGHVVPSFLHDLSLITEHLTEIEVDLRHYPSVSAAEEEKLLKVLRRKHPDRLMIVTIEKPESVTTVTYLNTFGSDIPQAEKISDLDTLLSLYLQVNSGASYA